MEITKKRIKELVRMLMHDHYRKTELVQEIIKDKKLSNKEDLEEVKPKDKKNQ